MRNLGPTNNCPSKYSDVRIQTVDLWWRKWPLCPLCFNPKVKKRTKLKHIAIAECFSRGKCHKWRPEEHNIFIWETASISMKVEKIECCSWLTYWKISILSQKTNEVKRERERERERDWWHSMKIRLDLGKFRHLHLVYNCSKGILRASCPYIILIEVKL